MPVEIGNGTWFFCPFSDLLSPPATTTIHMEYETIHEFENLFQAHMAARKGKADKEEVLRFEMELLWLLREILGSYHTQFGKGLPLGNQSSQWFALYYLDRMDRIVKERLRIKHYSRYMDDCVLIHPDKGYLKHCLAVMKRHVEEERKLSFNTKTQIVPISQGVDYLGFHLYLTETGKVIKRLRTSNKKRLRRKLKHYRRAYASGKIELSAITRSLASYRGHLSHGHTYKLRKNLMNHFILHRKEKGQ